MLILLALEQPFGMCVYVTFLYTCLSQLMEKISAKTSSSHKKKILYLQFLLVRNEIRWKANETLSLLLLRCFSRVNDPCNHNNMSQTDNQTELRSHNQSKSWNMNSNIYHQNLQCKLIAYIIFIITSFYYIYIIV